MFGLLKKAKDFLSPQMSFVPKSPAGSAPVQPPMMPPATPEVTVTPPQKPSLKQRILEGLPGFAGSAGSVIAAKAAAAKCAVGMAGLCATASPVALAAAGVGLSAALGGTAAQTASYVKDRWAAIEAQAGHKIGVRDALKSFNMAAAKRELSAFRQELNTGKFWKGALKKGTLSAAFGAAAGFVGSEAFDYVKEHFFAKPPVPSLSSILPHAGPAPVHGGFAQDALQPAPVEAPAPDVHADVAPASLPLNVDTALDHARGYISEDSLAADMLAKADQGNAQAIKDLAVGFNNGKFGVELNKPLAHLLFEKAAAMGNVQAIHDLGRHTASEIAAQKAATLAALHEAAANAAPDVAVAPEVSAPNATELAAAQSAQIDIDSARPETLAGNFNRALPLAGGCIVDAHAGPNGIEMETACDNPHETIKPGEAFRMRTPDAGIIQDYAWDGEAPVESRRFVHDSMMDFIKRRLNLLPQ